MIYICFSCKRDEPLLQLHYQAIKRVDPEAVVNYIIDESEINDMQLPKGSESFATDFNRNGNLIGIDALKGLLSTYKYISQLHNNQPIVKIDSDVILTDIEWLKPLYNYECDMIGISPSTHFCCHGSCYGLTERVVDKMIEFISNGYYWDLTGRVEDETITMLAAITTEPFRVVIMQAFDEQYNSIKSCVFTSQMYNRPEAIRCVKGLINCGDGIYTNNYIDAKLDVVQAKRRAMRFALRAIKG